jgi:hypothetical protein
MAETWWSTEFSIRSCRMAALLVFIEKPPLSGQKNRLSPTCSSL